MTWSERIAFAIGLAFLAGCTLATLALILAVKLA